MVRISKVDEDLGQKSIGMLLWQYSLPAIIATVATSVYNIVDRIFIGQIVGPFAIAGMTVTLPLMNICTAFGMLVSSGAAAMVSIRLGENRTQHAAHTLGNAVLLNLLISVVVSVVGLVFLDDILYLFGASSLTILYARNFMRIILIGNPITQAFFCLNAIMRSSGYPSKAMISILLTMVVNIVLVFVFVYVCDLGIEGAALATIWGQVVGLIWVLLHFCLNDSHLHFTKRIFKLRRHICRHICFIGLSPFFIHLCTCIVVAVFNWQLSVYAGDYAIGAYGIINTVVNFVTVIVLGLSQGMQPIVGYNYGAKQYGRVEKALWRTVMIGMSITIVGFVLMELFSLEIGLAFTKDLVMSDIIRSAMKICVLAFPLIGFQVVVSNFFQSIGKANVSIFLSLSRQVLFLVPLLLVLPRYFGLNGIWYAMPVADFLAFVVTAIVLIFFYRKSEQIK